MNSKQIKVERNQNTHHSKNCSTFKIKRSRKTRILLVTISLLFIIKNLPTVKSIHSQDDTSIEETIIENIDKLNFDSIVNNNYNGDESEIDDSFEKEFSNDNGAVIVNDKSKVVSATTKQINFVSPSQKLSSATQFWYEAPLSFSAKGMDHLYLLNQLLWTWLQPPGLPPEVIKRQLFEDPEMLAKQNKVRLLTHFWGMILATAVALCFAIIIPLLGLLLCCCSCGNTSKRRAKTSQVSTNYHHSQQQQQHQQIQQQQAHHYIHSSQPYSNEADSPTHMNTALYGGQSSRSKQIRKRCKYRVEKRCDSFYRSLFGTFLFILLLLISFFVICAFVTNEYIENGLRELPKTLNQSLDDYQLYLNNTQYEVNTLFRSNYNQLENELDKSLDKSGQILKDRLAFVTKAMSLDNLTDIVSKLDTINIDLKHLQTETTILKNHLHMLKRGLQHIKKNLEQVFNDCTHPICKTLRKRYETSIKRLEVTSHLDNLPDISLLIKNITYLLDSKIVDEVSKGKQHFDKISLKIQTAVKDSIPGIKEQINELGKKLATLAKNINEHLRSPFNDINEMKTDITRTSIYFNKYEIYRWYVCLGASASILLILALYTTGLLNCVCKHQPTINDYRLRGMKPTSALSLRCGIVLLFLIFGIILLGTIILFLFGGVFDRIACHYLENPSEKDSRKLFTLLQNVYNEYHNPELFDQTKHLQADEQKTSSNDAVAARRHHHNHLVDSDESIKRLSYIDILNNCHNNESLYNALKLYKYEKIIINNNNENVIHGFNITNIIKFDNRDGIENGLKMFLRQIDFDPGRIVILTKEANRLLDLLKETSFSGINFTLYTQLVNREIIPLNLIEFSQEIEREAELLPPSQMESKAELRHTALMIDSMQTKVISKIQDSVMQLKIRSEKIEKKSQYGGKRLKDALNELLNLANQAQYSIEKRGRAFIKEVAEGFVNDINSLIDQYYQHVIFEVEKNIGRCEPISRAVNASVMAVCKEIVLPFNGYWLSMASALLLCLPATICATILSKLLRKFKRSKDMRHYLRGDSDVNLDEYEDADIPLAQVATKETTSNNPYDSRRSAPASGLYYESNCGTIPTAPIPGTDDNWSPGAPPPHIYTRPPPYNFS